MTMAAVQSWVTLIKDIVTGLAVPFTGYMAWKGLTTWKRQLGGNADFEVARTVLRSVYKVRDEITYTRNPLMMGSEIAEAVKEAGLDIKEGHPDFRWRSYAAVWDRRLKEVGEAMSALEIAAIEADLYGAKKPREKVMAMRRPAIDLRVALQMYVGVLRRSEHPTQASQDVALYEKYDPIVYRTGDDQNPDDFDKALLSKVEEISSYIRAKIKR